jgi:hypothetical protein
MKAFSAGEKNLNPKVPLNAYSFPRILLALLATGLAFVAGRYVALHGLSFKEVIATSVGLIAGIAVLAGPHGVPVGFILWVCTLGLGYRTVELTRYLRLHPSEVLLWGLLALLVVQRGVVRRERLDLWLPTWVWLSLPFWVWGWIPGFAAGRPWDQMLAEFRDFALLIPLAFVASAVLKERNSWRSVMLAFYITGAWIAGMGILEYVFPNIRLMLPGFISNPEPAVTTEGFLRARFSFWGASAATFVCVLAVPMAVAVWQRCRTSYQRSLALIALAMQVFGIYLGGYRSMWLLLGVEFFLWALLRYGVGRAWLVLIPLGVSYQFLPKAAQERALSMILALEGRPVDSSAAKRWERLMEALERALRHPLGSGWAGSGWVHSDFAQVAANLGLLAGAVFLGAWLITLLRLWQRLRCRIRNGEWGAIGLALLLSFVAAGGILAMEGVQVLPQLVLPVWLVWILSELWIRQTT